MQELTTILPASAGLFFIVQSCYHWGLYRKLYVHSKKQKKEGTDTPPLSVIIVAKDSASDLQKNLPAILEQDYPDFEVIVIYDQSADDHCEDVLKLLQEKYPHLHHSFIPDSARYISHKKLGIHMGIKASHHEWLVFTEPNCRPTGNLWLRSLARHFTPGTDIVLGYSNYEKGKGWFNRKATFDTLLRSMRQLGSAIGGNPYAGCGRNMAYRKSLYYQHKGFASHLSLQRGEDDLFVNQCATGKNTRVEASPESVVRITAPHYKKDWREEQLSHFTTSRHYKGHERYLMGFETCSRLLFLVAVVLCVVYGILMKDWVTIALAGTMWLVRYLVQLWVFRKTCIALGERRFYLTLPLWDWMQPLWSLRFKLQQRMRRKDEFMRK